MGSSDSDPVLKESEEESGEGDRDKGSGIYAGVGGTFSRFELMIGLFLSTILGAGLGLARDTGFFLAGEGGGGAASAGSSQTSGRPVCGPLKFRMEEKCSQS
jgi:hypothetical protein